MRVVSCSTSWACTVVDWSSVLFSLWDHASQMLRLPCPWGALQAHVHLWGRILFQIQLVFMWQVWCRAWLFPLAFVWSPEGPNVSELHPWTLLNLTCHIYAGIPRASPARIQSEDSQRIPKACWDLKIRRLISGWRWIATMIHLEVAPRFLAYWNTVLEHTRPSRPVYIYIDI